MSTETTRGIVIVISRPASSPEVEDLKAIITEWEELDMALQLGVISRVGWDKMRKILSRAVREANDDIKGLGGYIKLLQRWQNCYAYDGRP
jgi:hypothetical protein